MKVTKRRVTLLAMVFVVIFVLFGLKLVHTQIVMGQHYSEMVDLKTTQTQTVAAARGEIVDRYGRPMVENRTGFNVIFDKAFFPKGRENETILKLMEILTEQGEEWIDNLPITKEQPFAFREGFEGAISRLKKNVGVAEYATVDNVFDWMIEEYGLKNYTPQQQRLLAGVRYEMVQRQFSPTNPYVFAEDVGINTITRIKEHSFDLPGVDVQESSIREYVCGDIAPHLIGRIGPIFAEEMSDYKDKGYLGNEIVGKEGLEKVFEEQLRGKSGKRQITFQNGVAVNVEETVTPQPGSTIVMTLDKVLQKVTQDALEAQIKNLQQTAAEGKGREASAGAAVVIQVGTGEVLAAATYPGYNLQTYSEDYDANANNELFPFMNRALRSKYAPGSTFKPCVATGGLNEGIITPTSTYFCGHVYDRWTGPGAYRPTCLYFNGDINVVDALRVSCNIFFYETGWNLGIGNINKYAQMYGLGEPTGIELPETIGQRSSPDYFKSVGEIWYDGDVVQAAIGQGKNEFSPLQIANYTATIANDGKRMKAHLVKSLVSYDFEQTVQEMEPEVALDMQLNDGVLDTVIAGMKASGGPNGTSLGLFNNYPFQVAAKTGTPQTSAATVNSVYICFAPADNPEIAIAVVIEDGWQGYTGAPVAKTIMDHYFFANADAQKPQPVETILS